MQLKRDLWPTVRCQGPDGKTIGTYVRRREAYADAEVFAYATGQRITVGPVSQYGHEARTFDPDYGTWDRPEPFLREVL